MAELVLRLGMVLATIAKGTADFETRGAAGTIMRPWISN
jgi:hypothetical protein